MGIPIVTARSAWGSRTLFVQHLSLRTEGQGSSDVTDSLLNCAGGEIAALRLGFERNEYCLMRGFFTPSECREIVRWTRYSDTTNTLWNFSGDPDRHSLLARVGKQLSVLLGGKYTFYQMGVHGSDSNRPRAHPPHIDAVPRFFRYGRKSTVQVWVLLETDNVTSEDACLTIWSGFSPGADKSFTQDDIRALNNHPICQLAPGDVLLFNAWCPHATGIIRHPYQRLALKIHYYSEDAEFDESWMRRHRRLPWQVALMSTHGGLEPLLFCMERFYGRWMRVLVDYPLRMMKAATMLILPYLRRKLESLT